MGAAGAPRRPAKRARALTRAGRPAEPRRATDARNPSFATDDAGSPSALSVAVAGEPQALPAEAEVAWVDRSRGVARLTLEGRTVMAVVEAAEGAGSDWVVTLYGRRIPATVQTRRERLLAAEVSERARSGPAQIRATLPGLVVKVAVAEGSDVEEGAPLVTIEAMKMQNEVRAPRAGRVTGIAVEPGRTVRPGESLLRIE